MPDRVAWPQPVEVLNDTASADIVLLCEHASNYIPAEYGGLGLAPDQLQRHIAWDIGAAAVTRRLSQLMDAAAYLGTASRLLIDLNRPLDAPDSIPTVSEETEVPGNTGIGAAEATRRAEAIFRPFHRQVEAQLDRRMAAQRPTLLVSIHSFTPVFLGVARPWHAGVLFDRAAEFGAAVIDRLRGPDLLIEANQPYKTDRFADYAIPIHGDDRGLPAIMIEFRNDLITLPGGVEEWATRIAAALPT